MKDHKTDAEFRAYRVSPAQALTTTFEKSNRRQTVTSGIINKCLAPQLSSKRGLLASRARRTVKVFAKPARKLRSRRSVSFCVGATDARS